MTPLDAEENRASHMKRLLGAPLVLSLGSVLLIAAFVAGTLAGGPGLGLIALAGTLALALALVWHLASKLASEDFFAAYAARRGLGRVAGRGSVPPLTPLLRKGDKRYLEQFMEGELVGGRRGILALYTYEIRRGDDNNQVDRRRYTVVLFDLPESATAISELLCERRRGPRFSDGLENAMRRSQRLRLESDLLDRRFEIFHDAGEDPVWLRRLFSPTFIVQLARITPRSLAFELSAGALCVSADGHLRTAGKLDELCASAARIADQIESKVPEPEPS